MGRAMEILVSISALAGIATFLGFRAMARSAVRKLGRKPEVRPPVIDGQHRVEAMRRKEEERRTQE